MKIYYTVYKIENKVNGKIYIGCHKTKDLKDGYMGSGKYLKYAQNKYGLDKFEKIILFTFDNSKDMYKKEAELVTIDFVSEENTYNLKVGGFGGWDHIPKDHHTHSEEHMKNMGKKGGKARANLKYTDTEKYKQLIANMLAGQEGRVDYATFKGKKHTIETKIKMSKSHQGKHEGKKNSQHGTQWIYNLELKKSKKIKKEEPIPEGWVLGRKIKF